jgi:hypothetical protein
MAFRTGLVWLRLAVEGRPEFDSGAMAFKSEVFTIEQIFLSVRDKKGPQLIESRGDDQNDDRRGKSFFAYLLYLAR